MTHAEQVAAFIKTHNITTTREGVSGRDLCSGRSERDSERERETFAAYAAAGCGSRFLEDRNFEISRRRR